MRARQQLVHTVRFVSIYNSAFTSTQVTNLYNEQLTIGSTVGTRVIDTLSTAAYNSMVYTGTTLQAGAFGVKLLLSNAVSNPVIQIKAGTGGTPTNFYAPSNGTNNLTTGVNGTGTGIIAFLNGATGYVTKWYDQTGNGHHATATNTAGGNLPFYDTTNFVVDFGSTGYFTLDNNSFPTGNLPYTYLYKQGRTGISGSRSCFVYSGGTDSNGQMELFLNRQDGLISDSWYGFDGVTGFNNVAGNVVMAVTYGGGGNNNTSTGKMFYMDNVPKISEYINSGNRNQTSTNCMLGYSHIASGTYLNYNSTMPYFYWMPYQLGSSDRVLLGAT